MSVPCECCVLSGSVLCNGLNTRPEDSYPVVCVCVCVREREREREIVLSSAAITV